MFISLLTLLWIGELGIRRNDIILTTKRDQIDERVYKRFFVIGHL